MAKGSGSTRLTKNTRSINVNRNSFNEKMKSGDYDARHSYFSEKTGASVLFMNGHNYSDDEDSVSKVFANNGFDVVMTPEGIELYATNRITKKGKEILKYSEGTVAGLTYEQATINQVNSSKAKSVSNAIEHAKIKGSTVAVIYDKKGLLHREDIQAGITEYESHKTNTYRAKLIIVVNSNLEMNFWRHDT